jgi:hypothetical protein
MDKITVHIKADVNPTESEEKVKKAIGNMFGSVDIKTQDTPNAKIMTAESKGLEALTKIYNILRRERIRDAARTALLHGLDRRSVSFCLNKQVAFAGHVSFSQEEAESPLGPIRVKIECENPREVIHWLTSKE